MPANEWFKKWFNSPYYHKLYFERDEQQAADFLKKLVGHLKPPPGSLMLEVACGRGRHSQMLSEAGFDVTGIDLSTDSIHQAHALETETLRFYQHDMRLPFWINYFHYAFNFFTSFGYFNTLREHEDAVRTIAASLRAKGMLVFDYLNTHFVEDRLVHNEIKMLGDTRYEIHRWQDDEHFYKKILITDSNHPKPLEFTEQVTKFNLGDFTDMLAFQKMQVSEVFGDYELQPYHVRNTPRMIVLATKMD